MARLFDRVRLRRRLCVAAVMAVIAAFYLAAYTESSHAHGNGPEVPGTCSVCQLVHDPGSTTGSGTPSVQGSGPLWGTALYGYRSTHRAIHLAPKHSRAPPLSVSL